MNVEQELDTLIRARYPVIWLETYEEYRAINLLTNIANKQGKELLLWSVTKSMTNSKGIQVVEELDAVSVLEYIAEMDSRAIIVLKDFHKFIDDVVVMRGLRDLHEALKDSYKTVIILAPIIKIPLELQKSITVVSLPLPNKSELKEVLDSMIDSLERSAINTNDDALQEVVKNVSKLKNGEIDQILSAGLGLTLDEFENVISKSIVAKRTLDVSVVISEKEQIIRKSGVLEFYTNLADLSDVGGLQVLKQWISQRKLAFSKQAQEFGLKYPRGVFLAGPPGTGKSLTAKVIAKYMQMPLLYMDVSRIFSKYVGESEQSISYALKIAEAVAPSVLWLDEVEKVMAGVQSSSSLDSGVTARVFGAFLTWLQEHEAPVLTVVTSNNPLAIPPEFMRAGRFDEVFLVDLPNKTERAEIFAIHIAKVKRNPEQYNIAKFAELSQGFSGAEIEAVIQSALFTAYSDNTELSDDYIISAIKSTIPLSKKRKEDIEAIRKWSQVNAVNASMVTKNTNKRQIEL